MKKILNVVIIIICIAVALILIAGVIYFYKCIDFFSLTKIDQKVNTSLKVIPQLTIVTSILKNSSFILQFVAWIVSLGTIILSLFAFMGIREKLSFQAMRDKMQSNYSKLESEYSKYKTRITDIDKEIKLGYELTTAKIFYTQGFYNEAWDILSGLADDNYEVGLYKGLTLLKRNDYFNAISLFENAAHFKKADLGRIYYNIGLCWFHSKQYEKSIDFFDKAIKEKSNYGPAYNQKALALRRLGQIKEAIATLKVAVSIDNKNTQALYNLACFYALSKKPDEAIENLRKAISFNANKYQNLALRDPDFEGIKNRKDFKKLLNKKVK
ncbi:tetratricopeptide repeat protein [bacterium]|nr:tetratricopeptide repeat protein [bacterium]